MLKKNVKEEKAIVLDFLPHGYPFDTQPMYKKTAIAQAMGENYFVLLELVPKKGVFLQPLEEVYIGDEKRDKIHHVIGKIGMDKLTETAKIEVIDVIKDMIRKDEKRFVDFFNKAQPINSRRHQIELLPGIGKRYMWDIVEKREEKEFESFEELKSRIKLMPDPEKAVIKRIVKELNNEDKYRLFVEV